MKCDASVVCSNVVLWYSIFLVWIVIASIYWMSAIQTDGIGGGDSAELALTALDHGTPHPPGYPILHMILSLGCRILQSQDRMDLIDTFFISYSVVTSATAATFYALFLCRFTGSILVGCTSFLFFALSDLVWTYSLHIEVFSLNHLFISVILNLMYSIHYQTQKKPQKNSVHPLILLLGAFFSGLSLCNQQTIIIYIGCWIPWVVYRCRSTLLPNFRPNGMLLLCGLLFLLGFLGYLYVPFTHPHELSPNHADSLTYAIQEISNFVSKTFNVSMERTYPPYSWGNTATWKGLFHHVLRRDYGSLRLFPTKVSQTRMDILVSNLNFFVNQGEFNRNVMMLFVIGIVRQSNTLFRGQLSHIGNILLFSLCVYLFGFFSLCNIPLEEEVLRGIFARFFQQANMIVYVFVALGVSFFEKIILWVVFIVSKQRIDRVIVQLSLFVVFMSVVCTHIQVSHPEYIHFTPTIEPSRNVFHTWAENVLDPLPENSIVLLFGDLETNIIHYYQHRWKLRPDVTVISLNHMSYPWWHSGNYKHSYKDVLFPGTTLATKCKPHMDRGENFPFSINSFIEANLPRRNMFALLKWHEIQNCTVIDSDGNEWIYNDKYSFTSFGLTNKIIPIEQEISIEDRLAILESNLPRLDILNEFHSTDKFNQSLLQFRFDKSSWETRLVWHYAQPWHTKAYYQYFKATKLVEKASHYETIRKNELEAEAFALFKSCFDIYEDIFAVTSIPLPPYIHQQQTLCKEAIQ